MHEDRQTSMHIYNYTDRHTIKQTLQSLHDPYIYIYPKGILNEDEWAAEVRRARQRDRARTMEALELESYRQENE